MREQQQDAAPMIMVEVLQATPRPIDHISMSMATCYASKSDVTYEKMLKRVKSAYSRGHMSVFEHASCTLSVEGLSRACMAQLTRHRLISFCVQSQRYVKQDFGEGDLSRVCVPPSIKYTDQLQEFCKLVMAAQRCYQALLEAGVPPQDARYVLPEGTTTQLVMTLNVRELFHLLDMRQDPSAQWEIQALADKIDRALIDVSEEWADLMHVRYPCLPGGNLI